MQRKELMKLQIVRVHRRVDGVGGEVDAQRSERGRGFRLTAQRGTLLCIQRFVGDPCSLRLGICGGGLCLDFVLAARGLGRGFRRVEVGLASRLGKD